MGREISNEFLFILLFFAIVFLKQRTKIKQIQEMLAHEKSQILEKEQLVNEQSMQIAELTKSNHLYETITDASPIPIAAVNELGHVMVWNRAAEETFLWSKQEVIGKPYPLLSEKGLKEWKMIHNRQSELRNFDVRRRKKDGKWIDLRLSTMGIYDQHGEKSGMIAYLADLTAEKLSQETIQQIAHYDPLTELPNSKLFKEQLTTALESSPRNHKLAVMHVDLTQFKYINESLGFSIGDILLKRVSKRIMHCLQEHDLLARTGGDKFTILLSEVAEASEAVKMAEQILTEIKSPFILYQRDIDVLIRCCLGISLYPDHAVDSDSIIHFAEVACKQAKSKGHEIQVYEPDLRERVVLERELIEAIKKDQFQLYYQPQIDLVTGTIIGVEALLRWRHPLKGFISPAEFIPLAEESGLILPLGKWVLRQACIQNKEWQEKGLPPIKVSVNLSIRQFYDGDLPNQIAQILAQTGLEPKYLCLEITETMTTDVEFSLKCLKELLAIGIEVHLDDFGTGYSSLSYIQNFPIHKLKIDQSFVRVIPTSEKSKAIVKTIISLAKNLRFKVIAEGVETQEQLDYLRMIQCDEVQGYVFSPPKPAEEFKCYFMNFNQQPFFGETILRA